MTPKQHPYKRREKTNFLLFLEKIIDNIINFFLFPITIIRKIIKFLSQFSNIIAIILAIILLPILIPLGLAFIAFVLAGIILGIALSPITLVFMLLKYIFVTIPRNAYDNYVDWVYSTFMPSKFKQNVSPKWLQKIHLFMFASLAIPIFGPILLILNAIITILIGIILSPVLIIIYTFKTLYHLIFYKRVSIQPNSTGLMDTNIFRNPSLIINSSLKELQKMQTRISMIYSSKPYDILSDKIWIVENYKDIVPLLKSEISENKKNKKQKKKLIINLKKRKRKLKWEIFKNILLRKKNIEKLRENLNYCIEELKNQEKIKSNVKERIKIYKDLISCRKRIIRHLKRHLKRVKRRYPDYKIKKLGDKSKKDASLDVIEEKVENY